MPQHALVASPRPVHPLQRHHPDSAELQSYSGPSSHSSVAHYVAICATPPSSLLHSLSSETADPKASSLFSMHFAPPVAAASTPFLRSPRFYDSHPSCRPLRSSNRSTVFLADVVVVLAVHAVVRARVVWRVSWIVFLRRALSERVWRRWWCWEVVR